MPKVRITIMLLALTLAACGGASSPPALTSARRCGEHGDTTSFCGAASASVKAGGRDLTYSGGECHTGPGHVVVLIGDFPLQGGVTPDRFALGVGHYEQDVIFGTATTPAPFGEGAPTDGRYERGTFRVYTNGQRFAGTRVSVVLEQNRTRGHFEGTSDGGDAVSGEFRCST